LNDEVRRADVTHRRYASRVLRLVFALSVFVLLGCEPSRPRRLPVPRDAGPDASEGADSGTDAGLAIPSCEDRAKWIYVFDESNRLYRFEPPSRAFVPVSATPLACAVDGGTPFSMAIDHDAVAWMLYSNGSLHRASTVDGTCEPTGYVSSQLGMVLFGMGFSSDAPMVANEHLFVAGPGSDGGVFATLDTVDLVIRPRGGVVGSPELTGNANAELWGFYPNTVPPRIAQLSSADGTDVSVYDLETVGPDALTTGAPRAWAFAFWGGDYWAFYRAASESTTAVYRFTPPRGADPASFTRVIDDAGLTIVGAGVSTCSPYILE